MTMFKRLAIGLLFSAIFIATLMTPTQALAGDPTYIYALNVEGHDDNQSQLYYGNMIHMYWLIIGIHYEYNQWHEGESISDLTDLAERTVAAMGNMPAGQHVVFDTSIIYWLDQHPADTCDDGRDHCLWWDNGVRDVENKYREYFAEIQRLGGEIDVSALDFENNMTTGQIADQSTWESIINDRRFSGGPSRPITPRSGNVRLDTIWSRLKANGFAGPPTVDNLLTKLYFQPVDLDSQLRWDAVGRRRSSMYVNRAACQIAREYFPTIKCFNFDQSSWASAYPYYDPGLYEKSKFGIGGHSGTSNAPALYGLMFDWGNIDGTPYPKTEFNIFKKEVNNFRALKLANPNLPITPWVPYKQWDANGLRDSALYEEMIFHILLSGADGLAYWNPHVPVDGYVNVATEAADVALSNVVKEFDEKVGAGRRIPLIDSQFSWDAAEVTTCTKNLDAQKVVCRVTNENGGRWAILSAKTRPN